MKMEKIIRGISLLLVLMVSVSILNGCGKENEQISNWDVGDFSVKTDDETDSGNESLNGNSNENKQQSTSQKNNTGTSATTSLTSTQVLAKMPNSVKNTTINCFFWEDMKNTDYGAAIKAFEKKTGITVKTTIGTHTGYTTEIAALIASGKSPDMILCHQNTIDVIKNLQPITSSGFNFNDTAWDKELMNDFTFNGKTYAMQVDNSLKQNTCVILYNKKALKKANLEDPYNLWKNNHSAWTWDKLWEMCGQFLSKNKNKEGYYGIAFGKEDIYLQCFNTGLWGYNSKTGKYESYTKTQEAVNRYSILMDMIDKKYAQANYDSNSFDMGYTLFNASFSSKLEKSQQFNAALRESGNLGYVPMPVDSVAIPCFEYCGFGIPIGAKNAAAVPYFVRFVFDPANYDLNEFYMDQQAREVVEDMIKRGNMCSINGWSYDSWNSMISGGAAQVKTVLDSVSATVEDTVAIANDEIATLKK